MKAVALKQYLPIENHQSFLEVDLPKPAPTGHDMLIAVEAVAVNPVDTKVRAGRGREGMKLKAASFHWEFMFARSMHRTPDMIEPHKLLSWVADEIDAGRIRTTVSEVLSPINAAKMREAHRLIETGKAKGKIVIEGF